MPLWHVYWDFSVKMHWSRISKLKRLFIVTVAIKWPSRMTVLISNHSFLLHVTVGGTCGRTLLGQIAWGLINYLAFSESGFGRDLRIFPLCSWLQPLSLNSAWFKQKYRSSSLWRQGGLTVVYTGLRGSQVQVAPGEPGWLLFIQSDFLCYGSSWEITCTSQHVDFNAKLNAILVATISGLWLCLFIAS